MHYEVERYKKFHKNVNSSTLVMNCESRTIATEFLMEVIEPLLLFTCKNRSPNKAYDTCLCAAQSPASLATAVPTEQQVPSPKMTASAQAWHRSLRERIIRRRSSIGQRTYPQWHAQSKDPRAQRHFVRTQFTVRLEEPFTSPCEKLTSITTMEFFHQPTRKELSIRFYLTSEKKKKKNSNTQFLQTWVWRNAHTPYWHVQHLKRIHATPNEVLA